MKKINNFKRNEILLVLFFVMYLLFQALLQISIKFPEINFYRGVFTSLQFGTCLLMIYVNRKKGSKIAITLMSLSTLALTFLIYHGVKSAIPGFCNGIFFIITIVIISRYDIKRDIENKTDMVTGVLNRRGLYLALQEKIDRNSQFIIINLNLNNFKTINDTYGHAYGDELLRVIASRIETNLGKGCKVARVGGAEFVATANKDSEFDKQEITDSFLEAMKEKIVITIDDTKVECYVDCYVGAASFPEDATDYESLIKYADIAMAEAMSVKSKKAYLFNSEMLDRINRQLYLKNLIKESLQKNYFYLVYQPQFEVNSKKLRGFETLIRMKTADGKFVSPAEFIPVAEKSDLIFQIDDYVLLRAMKEFKDIVLENPELTVSVNVSAKNFADIGFVEKISNNLFTTGFPSCNLEIEITEYCVVNSMDITTENIKALRAMGIKIALDDFGTGYTSLNYVASLPIDLLKIDKSLIDDIEIEQKRRDFVRTVISMGKLMDCELISEGVENDSQIKCLQEDGCNFIQGFVWGKPLMYDDAVKLARS